MAEKKRRVLPLGGRNLRGLGLCLGLFLLWICLLLPLGRDILDRNRQNGAMRNRIRQLAVFAGQWDPEKSGGRKKTAGPVCQGKQTAEPGSLGRVSGDGSRPVRTPGTPAGTSEPGGQSAAFRAGS